MNTTQKIVLAAASGAALGTLAGILFAPAKGKDTREQIAEKATEVKENLTDVVEKGKSAISDLTSKLKADAEGVKETLS